MTRALVTLVVDRSGSMDDMATEAEAGIAKFIADQAELTDVKVKVLLDQFSSEYEHVYGPVKAAEAPKYNLHPRGMTALYDAVGKGIESTRSAVEAAKNKPDKIVVVIVTDGGENSSQEFTFDAVTRLVEERKAAGWEFVFLASGLAAVNFGRSSGLRTTSYDAGAKGQTYSVYATASAGTAGFLRGDTASVETPETVEPVEEPK